MYLVYKKINEKLNHVALLKIESIKKLKPHRVDFFNLH